MFRISFDTGDIKKLKAQSSLMELDVQKAVNWYLNQVYRHLYRKHSRKYTYVTPPANRRQNVYRRSGKLLSDLSRSRFTRRIGKNEYEGGFRIPRGSYLRTHVGNPGESMVIDVKNGSQKFLGRMVIPLRAGLNSDGTAKRVSPRQSENMLILPYHVAVDGEFTRKSTGKPLNHKKALRDFARGNVKVDFSGEDTRKFHANSLIVFKRAGRKWIPLYVLASKVRIPKRIFIGEAMDKYYDELYDRIQAQVDKLANGL